MANVKWIKIVTDIFDNRKIKQIEKLPDGDAIIVIWFKLLCLAGTVNDGGLVYFSKDFPYTDDMLSVEFNRPIQTIKLALKTFERFEMIEITENVLYISSWSKYQNTEGLDKIREKGRKRVEKHRKSKQLEPCNVTGNVTVTPCNVTVTLLDKDIDIDKELDIELDKDITTNLSKELNTKLTNNTLTLASSLRELILKCWDKFYANYPKKVDKKKAEQKYHFLFKSLKTEAEITDKAKEILSGLKNHINYWNAHNTETRYIPAPTVWLNGERWNDEVGDVEPQGVLEPFRAVCEEFIGEQNNEY